MKASLPFLVSTLAAAILPCANLHAEEQVTVTFQGNDLTMPKTVFEAGQNAGKKMVEQFIQEQEKNEAQHSSAAPTPSPSQEDNEAQMQEAAQKLFEYAKTELKYSEEDARSFVAVAIVTYIQEALRHAFGQAFLSGGAPGPDQAKKQQEIVDSLKITNLYSYEDGGYIRIRGDVTNTGNAAVSSIQIEIQYLDSNGNVVDQGTAYVNGHLLPGKTGTFSTMQSLKDIAHVAYQTRVVVAYPADESDVASR